MEGLTNGMEQNCLLLKFIYTVRTALISPQQWYGDINVPESLSFMKLFVL